MKRSALQHQGARGDGDGAARRNRTRSKRRSGVGGEQSSADCSCVYLHTHTAGQASGRGVWTERLIRGQQRKQSNSRSRERLFPPPSNRRINFSARKQRNESIDIKIKQLSL